MHRASACHQARIKDFDSHSTEDKEKQIQDWMDAQKAWLWPKEKKWESPEWYALLEGQSMCLLCKTWADEVHKMSRHHIKRAQQYMEGG